MSKREGVTIILHGELWGNARPDSLAVIAGLKIVLPRATLTKLATLPSKKREAALGKELAKALVRPATTLLQARAAEARCAEPVPQRPGVNKARQMLLRLHTPQK